MIWVAFDDAAAAARVTGRREFRQHWPYHDRDRKETKSCPPVRSGFTGRSTTWMPGSAARTGQSHSFGGTYLELVPHERIRYTDKFDDANLPGEMQITGPS